MVSALARIECQEICPRILTGARLFWTIGDLKFQPIHNFQHFMAANEWQCKCSGGRCVSNATSAQRRKYEWSHDTSPFWHSRSAGNNVHHPAADDGGPVPLL